MAKTTEEINNLENNTNQPLQFAFNEGKGRNVLGYGLNTLATDTDMICSLHPMLKEEYRSQDHISIKIENKTEYRAETEESVENLYEKFQMTDSLNAKYSIFSAGISFGFTKEDSTESNRVFTKIVAIRKIAKVWLDENEYINKLDEDFSKELNDSNVSPEVLFRKYGTHLITGGIYGGRADASLSYHKDSASHSQNINTKLKFGIGNIVNNETTAEWNEAAEIIASNAFFTATALGGNGLACASMKSFPTAYQKWSDSVDKNTAVFCGIYSNENLIPVWKFAENSNRQKQLQNYYDDEYAKIEANITSASYIVDIRFVTGRNCEDAKRKRPNGYNLLETDLNHGYKISQGTPADIIYLCYKMGPKSRAITNILCTKYCYPKEELFTSEELNKVISSKNNLRQQMKVLADIIASKEWTDTRVPVELTDENGIKVSYETIRQDLNSRPSINKKTFSDVSFENVFGLGFDGTYVYMNITRDKHYKPIRKLEAYLDRTPTDANHYIIKWADSAQGADLNDSMLGNRIYMAMIR